MLKTKNFGRKSLNEIKEILSEMGLTLGMKLDGFEPPARRDDDLDDIDDSDEMLDDDQDIEDEE